MQENMASPTPRSVDDVQKAIVAKTATFPKRLRQCAEFVVANRDKIAVRTVAELAEEAGVQPSAFMRFCQALGFKGFSEMQRLYRDAYEQSWPDYASRIATLRENGTDSPAALLAEFADAGRISLENLVKSIDSEALDKSVRALVQADMIHIVGFRRSFPAASYLAYVFEKFDVPSTLHGTVGRLESRHSVRAGDAVVAISFAPYTRETIDFAGFARQRNVPVIAVTDAVLGPLGRLAEHTLTVEEADFGAFRSLSATLSLVVTLAVSVGSARS